jgi:hypothetical protein
MDMVMPVLDLLGGTKDQPRPLAIPGFFVQEDNVLAEFNIPPCPNRESFVSNIKLGLDLLSKALPGGFEPLVKSSHRFTEDLLADPRAKAFGCNPDFNAWLEATSDISDQNPPPNTASDPLLRSAGGHVIIGYDNPNEPTNKRLVKLMDAYLGIPSVILDRDTDRRKLYGKAAAYRHKPFGVEYRTLSSFWISNDELSGWVWDQTMRAIDANNKGDLSILDHEAFIIDTINTANVKSAETFVKKYGIKLP